MPFGSARGQPKASAFFGASDRHPQGRDAAHPVRDLRRLGKRIASRARSGLRRTRLEKDGLTGAFEASQEVLLLPSQGARWQRRWTIRHVSMTTLVI